MVILLLAEVGVFLAVWAYRRWVLAGGLLDDAKSDALGEHLVHRSSGRRLPFTAARHLGRRSDATFPVSFHRASLSRPRAAPPSGAAGRPPPLDGDWRVVTPFPERVNAALTTVTRERLAALFAEPVQAVRAARDRVWIEVDPGRRGLTDVELAPALAAAVELHRLLLQARPAGSAWTGDPWRRSPAALAAAHPAFLAAGTVGPFLAWVLMPAVEVASHAEIAAAGLKGALVAALAWLALLTWRTRGALRASGALWSFAATGALGLLLCGPPVALALDTLLNRAPPRMEPVEVLSASCHVWCGSRYGRSSRTQLHLLTPAECARGAREGAVAALRAAGGRCGDGTKLGFSLRTRSWRGDGGEMENPAPEPLFDALRPGQPVLAPVHPGALGVAWFRPVELEGPR